MNIDQIFRTDRKTIAIIVQKDGKVIVRAPRHVSKAQIMAFVNEKQSWIKLKLDQVQRLTKQGAAPRQFVNGETLPYLGEAHLLSIDPANGAPALRFSSTGFSLASNRREDALVLFTAWYRRQALAVIEPRVTVLSARFNLTYSRVRISSARTRWGSCSSLGTLSFSWRLVMAPPDVIDYVIIHELAHRVENNHSRRFWDRVVAMMPEYQEKRSWLKENGRLLTLGDNPTQ